jgi:hypothetical protein
MIVCLPFRLSPSPDPCPRNWPFRRATCETMHYNPRFRERSGCGTPSMADRWAIYHVSREFAHEQGDPCIGVVQADSKEQAEEVSAELWR